MLKVIVTEKGGAEKEWFFASDEVFIGRVANNGIVLPKPNVSKRHAVIRVVDDRIVFDDLKSTNGSYVNGRRVSGARDLAQEDRVYIGDYVLQIMSVEPESIPQSDVQPEPEPAEERGATIAMPAMDVSAASQPDQSVPDAPVPPEDFMEMPPLPGDSVIDQIPAGQMAESDESAAEVEFEVEVEEPVAPPPSEPSVTPEPTPVPPAAPAPPPVQEKTPAPAPAPVQEKTPAPAPAPKPAPVVPAAPVAAQATEQADPRKAVSGLARRLGYLGQKDNFAALRALAEAAGRDLFANIPPEKADFSDSEWQKLSDGVMRLVDRLRRENQIPAEVDPIELTQKVLFEFGGLGPLEELLGDSDVKAVVVNGIDSIQVIREGQSSTIDAVFSNEDTFGRVAVKLCSLAGIASSALVDSVVEGRLPDGSMMQIIGSPYVDQGRIIVIERPSALALTPEELVSNAGMTPAGVDWLKKAVESRSNIVVCGPLYSMRCVMTNSMAMMVNPECRVLALGGRREIDIRLPNLVTMNRTALIESGQGAAQFMGRVLPDYIVMNGVESSDAGLLQELGLGGFDGLMMSFVASSAEDCLSRLKLMIEFSSPGVASASVDALVDRIAGVVVVLGFDGQGRTVVTGVYRNDRRVAAGEGLRMSLVEDIVAVGEGDTEVVQTQAAEDTPSA